VDIPQMSANSPLFPDRRHGVKMSFFLPWEVVLWPPAPFSVKLFCKNKIVGD
jgi:hypothetical protein